MLGAGEGGQPGSRTVYREESAVREAVRVLWHGGQGGVRRCAGSLGVLVLHDVLEQILGVRREDLPPLQLSQQLCRLTGAHLLYVLTRAHCLRPDRLYTTQQDTTINAQASGQKQYCSHATESSLCLSVPWLCIVTKKCPIPVSKRVIMLTCKLYFRLTPWGE